MRTPRCTAFISLPGICSNGTLWWVKKTSNKMSQRFSRAFCRQWLYGKCNRYRAGRNQSGVSGPISHYSWSSFVLHFLVIFFPVIDAHFYRSHAANCLPALLPRHSSPENGTQSWPQISCLRQLTITIIHPADSDKQNVRIPLPCRTQISQTIIGCPCSHRPPSLMDGTARLSDVKVMSPCSGKTQGKLHVDH